MGVKISAMVFAGGPRRMAQHSVMIALADNADDLGVAWPGLELLADKSRMSVRNLIRVLDSLEREGWLVKRTRARGEHRRGNVYELNLARLSPLHGAETRFAREGQKPLHGASTRVAREKRRPVERFVSRGTSAEKTASEAGNLLRGDTLSRHAVDGAENAAACGASSDTVSPTFADAENGLREVTSAHREVTTSASRGDTSLADLLLNHEDAFQNRQEPSMEPPLPPNPPRRGGTAYALDASREGEGKSPARGGADGLTAEQRLDLAEANGIRARRVPPLPPWTAAEWAELDRKPQPIANPTDPLPLRSRRRRVRSGGMR